MPAWTTASTDEMTAATWGDETTTPTEPSATSTTDAMDDSKSGD